MPALRNLARPLAALLGALNVTAGAAAQDGPLIEAESVTSPITAGDAVAFAVNAKGSGELGYQWRRNGFVIAGATAREFHLPRASRSDSDCYDVVVSDATGRRVSGPLRLDVMPSSLPQLLHIDEDFASSVDGAINAMALLPGGRILIAGSFAKVNGAAKLGVARLNADGTLDGSFTAEADGSVTDLAIQGDGRIMLAGSFRQMNGVPRPGVARLNTDGSLDLSFAPPANGANAEIRMVRALPGGTVLLAGRFSMFGGHPRANLVRLSADGAVDPSFVPFGDLSVPPPFQVEDVLPFPDGRVLYCDFVYSLPDRARTQRLRPDGVVDATFAAGYTWPTLFTGVRTVAMLPDGDILAGGFFDSYNGYGVQRLVRLSRDGRPDLTFLPSLPFGGEVGKVIPARDGSAYVLAANASASAPHSQLARIDRSGAWDRRFAVAFSWSAIASATRVDVPACTAALLLDDGNFLVGGGTFREGALVRRGLVRTRAGSGIVIGQSPVESLAGGTISLTVVPVLDSDLGIEWYKNGTVVPGAHSSVLRIHDAQATDAGVYSARIRRADGSSEETSFTVTVAEAPPVLYADSTPSGFGSTVQAGTRLMLMRPALRSGSEPRAYQWYRNGTALAGETNAVIGRPASSTGDSGDYTLTISNRLGRVTTAPLRQLVADSPDWPWVSPLPQGNPVFSIAYLNGSFFAGADRGTLLRSSNGRDWTAIRLGFSNRLVAMAYGNDNYVVLTSQGGVLTSSDGVYWDRQDSLLEPGRYWTRVVFGDGRFVAAGSDGSVAQSADGARWTYGLLPESGDISELAYGAGRWLALTDGRLYESADASAWNEIRLPVAVSGVAYGRGRFIASTRQDLLLSSEDGLSWASHPVEGMLSDLQHTDAGFLATRRGITAAGESRLFLLRSTDGLAWTAYLPTVGGVPWQAAPLAYGNGVYVTTFGTERLLASGTDEDWAPIARPLDGDLLEAAASPDAVVAVGRKRDGHLSRPLIATSRDRQYWSLRAVDTNLPLTSVAYAGPPVNRFVAVGEGGATFSSADGETWETQGAQVAPTRAVRYLNGRFMSVGVNHVSTSADGARWTSTVWAGRYNGVAYGNGAYVVVGESGEILRSTDARNWTAQRVGDVSTALVDVTFGAGKFVAVSRQGDVFVARDGLAWLRVSLATVGLVRVRYVTNRFVALGSDTSYFVSADGENWVLGQHGSSVSVHDVVEFQSRLFAVGNSGSVLEVVTGTAGEAEPVLANLSVRAPVPVGEPLVVGLGVEGGSRGILVRAVGPGLGRFGVEAALAAPRLELFAGSQKILDAQGWSPDLAATFARVGAFPLEPRSEDAAFERELSGSFTIQASGGAAGVVLLEAYVSWADGTGRLTNLSTKVRTGDGENIVTAGFYIAGTGVKRVLVRVAGPALARFGVNAPLPDPRLAVFDSSGQRIAENDDWSPALAPLFQAAGAFRFEALSRDAAVLLSASAGRPYTIQASGPPGATGVVVIEVYEAR